MFVHLTPNDPFLEITPWKDLEGQKIKEDADLPDEIKEISDVLDKLPTQPITH